MDLTRELHAFRSCQQPGAWLTGLEIIDVGPFPLALFSLSALESQAPYEAQVAESVSFTQVETHNPFVLLTAEAQALVSGLSVQANVD